MTLISEIFFTGLLVVCLGLSLYLFRQGRMPSRAGRSVTPWVSFVTRLCFLVVAGFSILVINAVMIAVLALGFFAVSVMIEIVRRQRAAKDSG